MAKLKTFSEAPFDIRSEKDTLIFWHFEKCAGNTMATFVEKQFPGNFYPCFNLNQWNDVLEANTKQQTPAPTGISGSMVWGIHEILPENASAMYTTLLREPFERFISEFNFYDKTYYSLPETSKYIDSRVNYFIRTLGNGSFDLAQERLESKFLLFGTLEHFNSFIRLLSEMLNLPDIKFKSKNVAANYDKNLYEDIFGYFREKNKLDMRLYEWADKEFRKRYKEFTGRECSGTEPDITTLIEENKIEVEYIDSSPEILDCLEKKQYHEAVAMFEKLPGKDINVLKAMCRCYIELEEWNKAEQCGMKAVEINAESLYFFIDILQKTAIRKGSALVDSLTKRFEKLCGKESDYEPNRFISRAKNKLKRLKMHTEENVMLFVGENVKSKWELLKYKAGKKKIAVLGAGPHTRWLEMITQNIEGPEISAVLDMDDKVSSEKFWNQTPVKAGDWKPSNEYGIVISSDTEIEELRAHIEKLYQEEIKKGLKIINLYDKFPDGPFPKKF